MTNTQLTPHDALDVLVSAGTDHHPFDRVMRWMESWVAGRKDRGQPVAVLAQRGTSLPPDGIDSAELVDHDTLMAAMERAVLVVCHGGPATIMDARASGRVPIVVPRRKHLGEHVDDHQVLFARTLAERGQIVLAETEVALHRALDDGLERPDAFRVGETHYLELSDTLLRFEQVVERTLEQHGRRRRGALQVMLVCSTGGHLAQLYRLKRWWQRHDRSWVTFDKADARSLLRGEDVTLAYHPTTRSPVNLARNLWLALRLLGRRRPDIVISNGAGVAVPFFWVARWLRIPTAYIEVYDRIDLTTLTGRLCAPFTSTFMVQWPEQQRLYRDTVLVGRLL